MIKELVSRVFSVRNVAHLAHLKTKSFAEHVALESFYNDVIPAIDKIVEVYQGNFGLIDSVSGTFETKNDIADVLIEDSEWIQNNRETIAQGITPIENLIDELLAIYLQTIYKLVNLS